MLCVYKCEFSLDLKVVIDPPCLQQQRGTDIRHVP